MSDSFSVSGELQGDDLGVVTLSGEVDIFTAPRFKECLIELLDSGVRRFVVDLAALTVIDSTAIGVPIGGVPRAGGAGGSMALVVSTRPVERVLGVTGLDRVFSMYPTRAEALDALA
jgi:anti-sigma B factor antagonist